MDHVEFFEGEATRSLTGTHVVLRPLVETDADAWLVAALRDRSSYGFTAVPATADEARRAVHELLVARARGEALPFTTVAAESGDVVGATRYLTLRWWTAGRYPNAVEIGGSWLTSSAQRTGANTEAKLLMLTHAFDDWGVERVDLKTDARNERSRRAIERLGATFEGVLRAWQPSLVDGEDGTPRDSAMYSIVPSEWPAVRRGLLEKLAR